MEFLYESNVKKFTKYINKRLKDSIVVDTWGIYISGDDKNELFVEIDYLDDFHSRDMFYVSVAADIDILRMEFDNLFLRHLSEYRKLLFERTHNDK